MEMSPTSRNTLMIGGALILIALLLVCGPLSDRFGSGGKGVEVAPTVAAGPPADESGAVEAASIGALIGASVAELDRAALDDAEQDEDVMGLAGAAAEAGNGAEKPLVAAAVAGAAAGAGVAIDSGSGGGGDGAGGGAGGDAGGEELPAVSAGVPAAAAGALAADDAANAAGAFDNSLAAVSASGPATPRFPLPVAAEGDGSPQPFGIESATMLRVCDSSGSGCNSLNTISISIGGGGITPFKPGNPRGTP
jgi:hypothetical protein